MTGTVLRFVPRAELAAKGNLERFVDECRRSAVLGAIHQFDRNIWELGYQKGKSTKVRVVFSTIEAARLAKPRPTPALPEPFLAFAKAYLVYMQDRRPAVSQAPRLAALRCLEAALRRLGKESEPTQADIRTFEVAVEIASESATPAVAYRVAGQIEALADIMRELGFVALRGRWAHGLKRPTEYGSRISEQALAARQEKLPSAAAIRALGGIFTLAQGVADTVISAYCALMLCAPERVNEVMRLEHKCLVEGETRFAGKLGIRWPGSKGSEDSVKWLPTHMGPVAREAHARLVAASAAARRVATWYTANPTQLYLHPDAAHLRDAEVVSASELALILWGNVDHRPAANAWAARHGVPAAMQQGRRALFRMVDVERAVIGMLPETFPLVPGAGRLECQNALAIVLQNELHPSKATYACMFQTVDQVEIYNRLGSRTDVQSIFDRYQFTEDDGEPIRVTSHEFRHYLNTLAQLGGMSDAEIAIFSGRKDVRQNRAYDHRTTDEVLAPVIRAAPPGFMGGGLIPLQGRNLINRSELLASGRPASHTTAYGYCVHDFAAEPCHLHRDCLHCAELECVKGERHREENLRRTRAETEQALARARVALSDEEYGADAWVRHHQGTLDRIDQWLAVLDSPDVPAGSRIRIATGGAPAVAGPANAVPLPRLEGPPR